MQVKSRPEIRGGKPVMVYFLTEDDGTFIRECTQADLDAVNRSLKAAMLDFWRMPAGQLCEWGRPPQR